MSDVENPYQSPETVAAPVKPLVSQGALSETMLIHLKAASPWLRFVGIMGFISAGLMALTGVIFFVAVPFAGSIFDGIADFGSYGGALSAALGGGVGLFYIGLGALLFFPALFTYRFGEKINSYLRNGVDEDLELAFRNNKSLWKFTGIIYIISLASVPLFIIIGIIAVVVTALA